jgi:hypothetical protein
MKTKILLMALVLGINFITFAQTGHFRNMSQAQIDSIANRPADSVTASAKDSVKAPAMANDSNHLPALSAAPAISKTAEGQQTAAQEEDDMSVSQLYGQYGYLLPWLVFAVGAFITYRNRGKIKNPFKRKPLAERLRDKLDAESLRQQIKSQKSNSEVDRKAYAYKNLGETFMKAFGVKLKKDSTVDETGKLMKYAGNTMLEGKWWLRWKPGPLHYALGTFLALIASILLLMHWPVQHTVIVEKKVQEFAPKVEPLPLPSPRITQQTGYAVPDPQQTAVQAPVASSTENFVKVPAQGTSKPVVYQWGNSNGMVEQENNYLVTVQPGWRVREVLPGMIRHILSNQAAFDAGPGQSVDLRGNPLTGQIAYASDEGKDDWVKLVFERNV